MKFNKILAIIYTVLLVSAVVSSWSFFNHRKKDVEEYLRNNSNKGVIVEMSNNHTKIKVIKSTENTVYLNEADHIDYKVKMKNGFEVYLVENNYLKFDSIKVGDSAVVMSKIDMLYPEKASTIGLKPPSISTMLDFELLLVFLSIVCIIMLIFAIYYYNEYRTDKAGN